MHYSINPEQRPFYLQIYQKLRADIINGTFSYNSKLPSKRLLAAETGLSTVTIEHAYALLCDEGYIESRERSGYFVIFRADNGFAASSSGHIIAHTSPRARNTQYPAFSIDILSKTMRLKRLPRGAFRKIPEPRHRRVKKGFMRISVTQPRYQSKPRANHYRLRR